MRIIKLSVLAAIMLVAGNNVANAQDVNDILQKHETAIGGMGNWDNIKTIKKTGNISVQGMDVAITENMAVGKCVRLDFSVQGMNGFQIVTNTAGYMMQPGQNKVDTLPPEMLKAAQKQLDEKGMQRLDYKDYATNGTKAEFTGKDSVDNSLCYMIKFTDKDGNESTSYFDVSTYYLLRTEYKIKKDDQEQEVAINYKDYKKLPEGVVMPMSVTSPMGGEIVFKSIDLNKPVDEKLFIPALPVDK